MDKYGVRFKMGNDLLNTTSVKNKYIIFLTDGLPTTYIRSGYEGYTPANTTHNSNKGYVEGNFYNFVKIKRFLVQIIVSLVQEKRSYKLMV